jgi:hypothetical protein
MKLSECLPDSMLRESEWYNDFILTCGVRDIFGVRLVDLPHHCVVFGIHQQIGRGFPERLDSVVNLMGVALKHAAWRHVERLSLSRSGMLDESHTEVLTERNQFYFHVDNGSRYPDETGSAFSSSDDAVACFCYCPGTRARSGWHGFSIVVTDDRGQEIIRVRIGR